LADGVVRPVVFLAYAGQMRWRNPGGDELAATSATVDHRSANQAWRTALDAGGEWIPAVLGGPPTVRLTEVRLPPDAGAMVIATRSGGARAYGRLLHQLTGTAPVVVLSDDAGASGRITEFAEGEALAGWCGTDGSRVEIPRWRGGVRHQTASTPFFFAQGRRPVRARPATGEIASVFLPRWRRC